MECATAPKSDRSRRRELVASHRGDGSEDSLANRLPPQNSAGRQEKKKTDMRAVEAQTRARRAFPRLKDRPDSPAPRCHSPHPRKSKQNACGLRAMRFRTSLTRKTPARAMRLAKLALSNSLAAERRRLGCPLEGSFLLSEMQAQGNTRIASSSALEMQCLPMWARADATLATMKET